MTTLRKWLGERSTQEGVTQEAAAASTVERGMPRVQRPPSLTGRVTQWFAIGLVTVMGIGVLGWYYASAAPRPELARVRAEKAARDKASGDQELPKLPPFEMPKYLVPPSMPASEPKPKSAEVKANGEPAGQLYVSTGHEPAGPTLIYRAQVQPPETAAGASVGSESGAAALARQLTGKVFARNAASVSSSGVESAGGVVPAGTPTPADGAAWMRAVGLAPANAQTPAASPGVLADEVKARVRGAASTRLPEGAVIDCTLLTAIDSQLPGLTTCVTATDVFGADGKVVLLERGTRLVGEANADVKAGQSRVRVIWHEARTPAGVAVNLDSPATDALGRSGLGGVVDRRFMERFGAAILMSVIDGAIAVAVESQRKAGGSNVVVSGATGDIATEALKETVGIPPRILVAQGARVAVLVAKDVDFSGVYALVRKKASE